MLKERIGRMTSANRNRLSEEASRHRHHYFDLFPDDVWNPMTMYHSGYDFEEELVDQLAKLPMPEEVVELMETLRINALRQLSSGIINGTIDHIRCNESRLDQAKFINSWIATAEETVAAGRNYSRIAARRK
jgi:hypothetical protein